MTTSTPTVMVVSSTAPRWIDDTEPRFVLDLCRELAPAYRTVLLTPHCEGAAAIECLDGVEVRRYRYFFEAGETLAYRGGLLPRLRAQPWRWLLVPFFLIAQTIAIARFVRRESPAIVHAHWLIPGALCAWIALRLAGRRIPLVCTVHGSDVHALRGPVLRAIQRFVANRCDRVCAVSPVLAQTLREIGVEPQRVQVLPMGVPAPPPRPARKPGFEFAFAGRLVGSKGVATLLRAFRQIQERMPEARLTIAGGGPEEGSCRALARELSIESQVRFLGAVPHAAVLELFARSDMAIVPSENSKDGIGEGLGLVALEAMAAGCPVVASDLPAFRSFIEHGKTGFLFPAGQPAQLAAVLLDALQDRRLLAIVAENARALAISEYGWSRAGHRYRSLFKELLPA